MSKNVKEKIGKIRKVSGPLVIASQMEHAKMYDVVKVGEKNLIGEIIEIHSDEAYIQVYEETGGLGPGENVYSTNEPLSVELAPGLLTSIYDGIQRPLDKIREISGDYITRGIDVPGIDREKKWEFKAVLKKGDAAVPGDIIGTVQETEIIEHRIMIPPHFPNGKIKELKSGTFTVTEILGTLETDKGDFELKMMHRWPVRKSRPILEQLPPTIPLVSGQRVIDAFFPIAKGGTACVPGPFGSGKTVIQHQLAKWADAQIIVYVGCGERGNEMTDVLMEFPELIDPHTGKPLMSRTVLIANTSNMPVAAREASVFTGITIAEYFRDMGYSVALMADSTSRWAEAMREISGRLEEMPGEEGYPAYLGSKIASFYERAGRVKCLSGKGDREGALSVIGAVSPPGGDFSDPVVQSTLRVVKVFWALESALAYTRHFPAISWLNSYSLYHDNIEEYLVEKISKDWPDMTAEAMRILQEESELIEIVRLVGKETLSKNDQLTLETARSIREDFLHQNAFHEVDTYTSFKKMYKMLGLILTFHHHVRSILDKITQPIEDVFNLPVREKIVRAKYIPENNLDEFEKIAESFKEELSNLAKWG